MEKVNTPEDLLGSGGFQRDYFEARIPVIDKVCRFRSLNAREHEELKHLQAKRPKLAVAIAISSTLCNDDGDLIFTPDDAEKLASMHAKASDAMLDVIVDRCVNKTPVDEMIQQAVGNSSGGEAAE